MKTNERKLNVARMKRVLNDKIAEHELIAFNSDYYRGATIAYEAVLMLLEVDTMYDEIING